MDEPRAPAGTDPPSRHADARRLAREGEWTRVLGLLEPDREGGTLSGERAALYGEALLRTGRTQTGREWLQQLLPSLQKRGDPAVIRRVTNLLGAALLELGLLDDAVEMFERAAELAWASGDDLLLAKARNNLGAIANIRGRRDQALTLYQLAVPAYQRLGSANGLAECFHNMAITFRDRRALDEADEYERRAIEFASEAGSNRLAALAQLGRAEISLRRGDVSFAEVGAGLATTAFRAAADPFGEGDALRLLGITRTLQGRLAAAKEALDASLTLAREHGGALNEAETLRALAEWAAARSDTALARSYGATALAMLQRLSAVEDAADLVRWLETLPTNGPEG